jgi:hypothetical protein
MLGSKLAWVTINSISKEEEDKEEENEDEGGRGGGEGGGREAIMTSVMVLSYRNRKQRQRPCETSSTLPTS